MLQSREDIVALAPQGASVVELGVAAGAFSAAMLARGPHIARLWSIDRWAGDRGHDDGQYAQAQAALAEFGSRSQVIRATFERAAGMFPGGSLDMVYLDGYAHQGEGGVETLRVWWRRLKPGGVLAGHDYSPKYFPLVCDAVDAFAAEVGGQVELTGETEKRKKGIYKSWIIRKAKPEAKGQ
jgi:predicted O-methyltransferase YrrM